LHEFLGYSWDEVHEEAERLEHFISERLEDRIAAKLGDPEMDPHGHLIPERSGAVPFRRETPLTNWVCACPRSLAACRIAIPPRSANCSVWVYCRA